jgi:two-component system sensor kinase FixL
VIEESIALAMVARKQADLKISLELEGSALTALVDKVQIQQVLLNLIRNAAEAMEGQPRQEIRLVSRRAGTDAEISVIDSGPGLAPEVSAQLFQPFVTTKADGMGVGLSICRTIVEAHSGRLWCEENPSGGTIFRFTLPQLANEVDNG